MFQRVADFRDVVRRNVGRHADRDAARPVGQQIGEGGGQHDRLVAVAVVGAAEVDRVLVDPLQQRLGHLGHPRLGVAHGRRAVAVDVAEVALAVDQRITNREVLRQAHQRLINRGVAVRVELADHVADDAGRLFGRGRRVQPKLAHREQQPAMHRLQPVAHVGQRTRHDGGEGVAEIPLAERLGQRLLQDFPRGALRGLHGAGR